MDYATKYKRAATAAQKQKAKAAAPKRRAIPDAVKPKEGCCRSATGQAAIRPAANAAYGFLKLHFLPHFSGQLEKDEPSDEADFYTSFGLLCHHYGITPMQTRFLGYPYNKNIALWQAGKLLRERREDVQITESRDAKGCLVLQGKETYTTGNTLYYIPIVPLHRLLKHRSTKKAAELLLCTCAYLMHVAGIPYYTDEGSYLCWQYDMVREWLVDDPEGWEQDYYWQNRSQLNQAEYIGKVMERRLWNPCHLNRFADLVAAYMPLDSFGSECLSIAEKALLLWQEYPHRHVYRNAETTLLHEDADDYDRECITMDKYIGFCATTEGWLYHTLSECVNNEFNECCEIQEPVLTRTFDGRAQDADSLDFECRLFALIDDLCYLLNTTDDEKS